MVLFFCYSCLNFRELRGIDYRMVLLGHVHKEQALFDFNYLINHMPWTLLVNESKESFKYQEARFLFIFQCHY